MACVETRVLCSNGYPRVKIPAVFVAPSVTHLAVELLPNSVCFREGLGSDVVTVQRQGQYVIMTIPVVAARRLGLACDARIEVCVNEYDDGREICVRLARVSERTERIVHGDRGVLLPRWAEFTPGEVIYACLDTGKVVYSKRPVGDMCRTVKVRRFVAGRGYVYGKVTIPAWFAHILGITPGDCVMLEKDGDRLLLWRVSPRGKCLSYMREG